MLHPGISEAPLTSCDIHHPCHSTPKQAILGSGHACHMLLVRADRSYVFKILIATLSDVAGQIDGKQEVAN
jgi:hypothetical protein